MVTELLRDHTFRTILLGTSGIGVVAGGLGVFAYLRKQSLASDLVAHAALPGVALAFIFSSAVLGSNKQHQGWLVSGAVLSGLTAVAITNLVASRSRVRLDAAMAVILATFFGLGMLLMHHIHRANYAAKGGLKDFLFGNASVLTREDLVVSFLAAGLALGVLAVCWRQFTVRSFDPNHSQLSGIAGRGVDALMFGCVVVATVIGLRMVGLVLMVAFVVTPPAAARQWTNRLVHMIALSAAIGGIASAVGVYLSILLGNLPTGPVIVLVLFTLFALSLLVAPGRGIIARALTRTRTRRQVVT